MVLSGTLYKRFYKERLKIVLEITLRKWFLFFLKILGFVPYLGHLRLLNEPSLHMVHRRTSREGFFDETPQVLQRTH